MRAFLGLAAAIVACATVASAESSICGDCYLGVYDDLAMTRVSGVASSFQVKSLYLGLRLGPGVNITDIDFFASYPAGFEVIDVESYVPGATYETVGHVAHVHWPSCVGGSLALFRVRVITTTMPHNAVVQLQSVLAKPCGGAPVEAWRIPAGCYVLNPGSSRPPCATAVEASTWSLVKGLFRTLDSR